jgi:hypothetical protein
MYPQELTLNGVKCSLPMVTREIIKDTLHLGQPWFSLTQGRSDQILLSLFGHTMFSKVGLPGMRA